jgi:hypothetical protein
MRGLAGEGRSPSLVWHAQAIGILFELGFLPTALCVREHLEVIERRLEPANCHDPERFPDTDPWLLRTRHVAWVLACLSEMPQIELAPGEATVLRDRLESAVAQHKKIVRTAAAYLLGIGDDGPATWVGRRGDDLWSEVWEDRQFNLLNTLYAMLALCRAERHGYLDDLPPQPDGTSHATAAFGGLLSAITVEKEWGRQLEIRWRDRRWTERWSGRDLPSGVVALFALTLAEYSSLLLETSPPDAGDEEMRALAARSRAQRLAHVLLMRTKDNATDWTASADAFYSEKAEGAWFVPTYSTAARAILETGVVDPRHPIIARSFAAIESLAIERSYRGGTSVPTWLNPTRDRRLKGKAGISQHRLASFQLAVDDIVGRPDAAGIHAACMAWAGLRRAVARLDPRDLMHEPDTQLPPSPFRRIEAEPEGQGWRVLLVGDGDNYSYRERAHLTDSQLTLLRALAQLDTPAFAEDVIKAMNRIPSRKVSSIAPANLAQKIKRLNEQFATSLISTEDGRYYLAAPLTVG